MKFILVSFLSLVMLQLSAQFSVSSNNRYLLKDGKPFFWLGDTGWELFHRLNKTEAEKYLKRRSEQGFTVIQAVALAEMDGLHTPNANGDIPLIDDDPTKPNEKYFSFMDTVIDIAASYNINIALLPTWGDKVFKDRWGTGPEIFNEQNAAVYAQWLAHRYKNKKNIIWILGGDRIPRNDADKNIWRAMGNAIKKETDNKAVISFHPQPNKFGSAEYFPNDNWIDFHMFQTGHCRDAAVYDKIQSVYNMQPVKPVMDAEPIYEDHPVCFNAKELGTSNSLDVRRSAYLDLFAGAFGHTYGCHDIWQMYSPKAEPVNGPHLYWQEAMELPGANQMKYLRNLVEAFPFLERIPDQSVVEEKNTAAAEKIQSTRGDDYLMVYTTAGKPFTVNMGKIKGTTVKGFWYNPRKGEKTIIDAITNTGSKKFFPPGAGYGQDWVLVLFDAVKNYEVK
jgi:Protein of unknown function (DUF4038)/Putative collagen-binding domain of a collagenase